MIMQLKRNFDWIPSEYDYGPRWELKSNPNYCIEDLFGSGKYRFMAINYCPKSFEAMDREITSHLRMLCSKCGKTMFKTIQYKHYDTSIISHRFR